jgi:hypothetical protein
MQVDREYVENVLGAFANTIILLIDSGDQAIEDGASAFGTAARITEAITKVQAKAVDLILNPDVDEKVGASV